MFDGRVGQATITHRPPNEALEISQVTVLRLTFPRGGGGNRGRSEGEGFGGIVTTSYHLQVRCGMAPLVRQSSINLALSLQEHSRVQVHGAWHNRSRMRQLLSDRPTRQAPSGLPVQLRLVGRLWTCPSIMEAKAHAGVQKTA